MKNIYLHNDFLEKASNLKTWISLKLLIFVYINMLQSNIKPGSGYRMSLRPALYCQLVTSYEKTSICKMTFQKRPRFKNRKFWISRKLFIFVYINLLQLNTKPGMAHSMNVFSTLYGQSVMSYENHGFSAYSAFVFQRFCFDFSVNRSYFLIDWRHQPSGERRAEQGRTEGLVAEIN